jgi:hypothetical protein
MRKLLVIVCCLLSACASTPKPIILQTCDFHFPDEPNPPIYKLNPHSSPDEVMKAYVATVVLYEGWINTVTLQVENSK